MPTSTPSLPRAIVVLLAVAFVPLLVGCFSMQGQYRYGSPVGPEYISDRGYLREPYWQAGDDLLSIDRIDRLVPRDGNEAPDRVFIGVVKYVRMRGPDQGHVVRFVEDHEFNLRGYMLPDGRAYQTLGVEGKREVGAFAFGSDKAQYHFAIKNILNENDEIDTVPWSGDYD